MAIPSGWVFVEVEDNSLIARGTNYVVEIRAKNVGKTPAIITGIWTSESANQNFISTNDPPVSGLQETVLPNRFQVLTSPNIPQSLVSTGLPIYIWGTVYYKDIFGIAHWTQFCYALVDGGKNTDIMTTIHNACDDTQPNQ